MSYQPHSFVYKAPPLISIQPQCSLQRDSSLWGGTTSSYNIKPLPSIPSINHYQPSYNNYRLSGDISNTIEKDFQKRAEDYEKKTEEQKQENEYLQEKIKKLERKEQALINQIKEEKEYLSSDSIIRKK